MRQNAKTICLIVILCIALGIALCTSFWLMHSAFSNGPADAPEVMEAEPTETVVKETEIPETTIEQTEATEETIPEETEETVPVETEAPVVTIDTVPQYFQTDYPDVRYGTGTIANSGCNMTSLAMVASYMTDHAYYPDEIADYLADFIGNNLERLEYGSDLLQLSWRKAQNVHDALQAVREGKVVIALMNDKSLFTNGYHFIVLTGVNDEGRILVQDPNESNYSSWNLADSFENGFTDGYLICGFSGAWIYDKSEMPEEKFIYEPVPYAEEPRYPGLELTEEEIDLMAKLIWAEAQSEPFEGQQAIAEVILNRYVSGDFQSSIRSIIYADDQFEGSSQMYLAEPTYSQYKAIDRAINGPYVLEKDVVFFAKFAVNKNVWGQIGDHIFCYSYNS